MSLGHSWGRALRKKIPYPLRKLWEIGRKAHYTALGFSANLFLGPLHVVDPFRNTETPLSRIAVLGRGKSSELFVREAKKKVFSAVVLCNFENRELASPELIEAIRRVPTVILLLQIGEPSPTFRVAKSIGVNCVVIKRRRHDLVHQRKIWRVNRLGLPVQPLPDSVNELKKKTSTGIVGVEIGSILSDIVEVFGIEFYRTSYISSEDKEIGAETLEAMHLRVGSKYQQRGPEMQQSFERIATRQASTQFILHCFEDHTISLDNVALLRVADEV